MSNQKQTYILKHKIRFITATALFDGHDASINIFRRLLQSHGVEVVHLGHNRSVEEIVHAVLQEDAQGVCVSSYQGGHLEFFKYMRDRLVDLGRSDAKIFGGGGGVIIPEEIEELHNYGISRLYSPDDGLKLGLDGIIIDMLKKSDFPVWKWQKELENTLTIQNSSKISENLSFSRALSIIENDSENIPLYIQSLLKNNHDSSKQNPPVLGMTGTGGSGKSSLSDELILRLTMEFPELTICMFSIDPSKKKTGGALLGDRIRMNAIEHPNVFMHSFATRDSRSELSKSIKQSISLAKSIGFDLIIVETSGIGQGDTGILDVSDISLYVMTSEFGAQTQLEKIDMLDFADFIAINKFDRRGSLDAYRDVKTIIRRSRLAGNRDLNEENYPVYGTIASKFNDDGVNALYKDILKKIETKTEHNWYEEKKQSNAKISKKKPLDLKCSKQTSHASPIIPQTRSNYLSEIAHTVREYHKNTQHYASVATNLFALEKTKELLTKTKNKHDFTGLDLEIETQTNQIPAEIITIFKKWPSQKAKYETDKFIYTVRQKEYSVDLNYVSLSGTKIKKVYCPQFENYGDLVKFLRSENLPGEFPYTSGVFPFKRVGEDPKRQFAGEGGPGRTNSRFHYLTKNDAAKRLSTAFDSVTLYGEDSEKRPDIYGKVGESGVSIDTLDDMKLLYNGFDLCDPNTSVSMTINGPAPILLAFFFNTAIDAAIELATTYKKSALSESEKQGVITKTIQTVRGTVQADILKEDQAQNTCIFSVDFALKMMGDIQEYFIKNTVRNYYSVSISGYHIAEAGANPISQLAFTLANGFTYVEYYLSRGMHIDDFAPNLAFFFSNGMDPEYSVIGRVARRIWAVTLKEKYGANSRSQKLKYHIQTSGRSLHAQEIDFNDIRTTLQALMAMADNCNSLHTNAYDEAITTPTEESVRRSMAIQLILAREYGPLKNENVNQGSYFIETLTGLVEEAVLKEFDRISARGGVLGAMETQYQRSKIQEESLYYETLKHTGELPLIGVNTFLNPDKDENQTPSNIQLSRASYDEKDHQLSRLKEFQTAHEAEREEALERLKDVVLKNGNTFEELLHTTRYASLGQITQMLYQVGGKYRRAM